jgi:hypothetical protein
MTRDEICEWYKDWCDKTGRKPLARERFLPKFREQMGKEIVSESRKRVDGSRAYVFEFKQD